MKTQFDKQTRAQFIGNLKASNISRQIDKMDIHEEYRVISLESAQDACKSTYRHPSETVHVKVYCTRNSGMYGYQFLACVWIRIDGDWYQASGEKTGGWGYDKISTAIGSAFRAVGVPNYIDGTGQHREFIESVGKKLLGRKPFFMV